MKDLVRILLMELLLFASTKPIEALLKSRIKWKIRDKGTPNVLLRVVVIQNGQTIQQRYLFYKPTKPTFTVKSRLLSPSDDVTF